MSTYGNALLRKDGEYPLFDGLGSERTVTNSSQTVTGTLTLDGFGQTVTSTGSSTDPYMFGATSGYRTEGDAGLMQVGARYYDAQVGRFITRDTFLDQHPYLYCHHDPVNCVDPSGHSLIGGLIGIGVGLVVVGLIGSAILIATGGAGLALSPWIVEPIMGAIGGFAGGFVTGLYDHEDPWRDGWNGIWYGIAGGLGTGGSATGPLGTFLRYRFYRFFFRPDL